MFSLRTISLLVLALFAKFRILFTLLAMMLLVIIASFFVTLFLLALFLVVLLLVLLVVVVPFVAFLGLVESLVALSRSKCTRY